MTEISAATGADYDRIFVQRLREAHGIVLPIIAEVRVSTRNDLVREFADTSDAFVQRHIELPRGHRARRLRPAARRRRRPGLFSGDRTFGDLIVPILVFIAALLAAVGLVAGLRKRAVARPARVVAPPLAPVPGSGPAAALAAIPAPRPTEISGAHRFPGGVPGGRGGGYALLTEPATTVGGRYTDVLDHEPDADLDEETIDAVFETRDRAPPSPGRTASHPSSPPVRAPAHAERIAAPPWSPPDPATPPSAARTDPTFRRPLLPAAAPRDRAGSTGGLPSTGPLPDPDRTRHACDTRPSRRPGTGPRPESVGPTSTAR